MSAIISTIEQLRKTVKLNTAIPFETVEPFLQTARDMYLVRYLGTELVEILEDVAVPERATKLLALTRLALGPLALWCGNAELSVRFSDSGFTVSKQDGATGYVPASDTKIAKIEESLERRGFQYLDQVLEYLETNADLFPEWKASRFYTLRGGNYIQTATQFQEIGLVDIDYSRLTFESLRPSMGMIELRFINEMIGETLDATLRGKLDSLQTPAEIAVIAAIRRFVACKTAELHTSQASKANRSGSDTREYKPLIRPIYSDTQNEGNFFAEQAIYYFNRIQQLLNKYAVEFGIEVVNMAMEFNSTEVKIFNMEG